MIGKTDLKLTKVIGNEECTLKKKLLVVVLKIKIPSEKPCSITAKQKLQKLCKPETVWISKFH